MSRGSAPDGSRPAAAGSPEKVVEILARFARRAPTDGPAGTIQLAGCAPVAFAGWLDLMARVEELLAQEPDSGVP